MRKEGFEVLQIKLPDYLADWLVSLSEEFAMTPSQFLTNLLQHYYEIYRKGSEKNNLTEQKNNLDDKKENNEMKQVKLDDLPLIAEKIIAQERSKGKYDKTIFIAKPFALWAKEKFHEISEINDNIIDTFLQEYMKGRNLKGKTLYTYRSALKKFIRTLSTGSNTEEKQ